MDYAKIYQFENFKRTMKRVLKSHTGVAAGTYVVLHIKDVHKDAFSTYTIILTPRVIT